LDKKGRGRGCVTHFSHYGTRYNISGMAEDTYLKYCKRNKGKGY